MCIVNYGIACTVAARKSYEMAGVTARDIDLGGASLAGPCPVNADGGNIAEGIPPARTA